MREALRLHADFLRRLEIFVLHVAAHSAANDRAQRTPNHPVDDDPDNNGHRSTGRDGILPGFPLHYRISHEAIAQAHHESKARADRDGVQIAANDSFDKVVGQGAGEDAGDHPEGPRQRPCARQERESRAHDHKALLRFGDPEAEARHHHEHHAGRANHDKLEGAGLLLARQQSANNSEHHAVEGHQNIAREPAVGSLLHSICQADCNDAERYAHHSAQETSIVSLDACLRLHLHKVERQGEADRDALHDCADHGWPMGQLMHPFLRLLRLLGCEHDNDAEDKDNQYRQQELKDGLQ
mmetsp:Transcript_67960/g.145479  ORF Transcript_67960/g.145479 Transcript_67960/m.145479 type:complete len:297 (-) Transcript_67960:2619-3509(-)